MSEKQLSQQQQKDQALPDSQSTPAMVSNASMVDRVQAIQTLNIWLEGQLSRIQTTSTMFQQQNAHGVLQAVEDAWAQYERTGYLLELPASVGQDFKSERAGIFLPTELASNIRPLIEITESTLGRQPETSPDGVDWNTRLGIPQYRTQSDNLTSPEASCNVTTIAMILERLGFGRTEVVAAIEKRMEFQLFDSPESRRESWLDTTMRYLNRQMRAPRTYQRIRGEVAMSNGSRQDIANTYSNNAQMEDLLDFLLYQMGQARTSVISNPDRLLDEVSGGQNTPTSEKIWSGKWEKIAPRVQECIENGGGAALSFRHKGTRSNATHIVSILAVESDGFRIDDPYGDIRDDYSRQQWDDAYWSRNDSGKLIASRTRSVQQNEQGNVDDWGTAWALDLPQEEQRGRETFISSTQVIQSMFYIQLFHRGEPNKSSQGSMQHRIQLNP